MEIHEMAAQIENWQDADRRKIGLDAVSDARKMNTVIIIETEHDVMGIATLTDVGELLNLATRESGWGVALIEKVAQLANASGMEIRGMSTDQAVGFYAKLGFVVEGYPGENAGVSIWWPRSEMKRFLAGGTEREAMQDEARTVYQEYLEYIENN